MQEINKKIKRFGIIWLVLGAVFVSCSVEVFFWFDGIFYIKYITAKKDVYTENAQEMKEEECFVANIPVLYGTYANTSDGCHYIMPTADGTYMGVYVYNVHIDQADKLVEDSQIYISDNETESSEYSLTGRGFIYEMDTVEQEYFRKWFEEQGYDQETINRLCYKTYILLPQNKFESKYSGVFDVGRMTLVGGLFFFSLYLLGIYKWRFKLSIRKQKISVAELEKDMEHANHKSAVSIGDKYTIIYSPFSYVIAHSKLVWLYVETIRQEKSIYYLAGHDKTYVVQAIDDKKVKHQLPVTTESEGNAVIEQITKNAPHVLQGHSKEYETMYKKDFANMKRIVSERKKEMEYGIFASPMQDEIDRMLREKHNV